MQIIFDSQEKTVAKIEVGEEFIATLTAFAKERDKSATFSMIGGANLVDVAYYDMDKENYLTKTFTDSNIEVLPVTGNIAWFEGSPVVHAHGVFSGRDYVCFGGHIMKLMISITGELVIDWLPTKMERERSGPCLKLLVEKK